MLSKRTRQRSRPKTYTSTQAAPSPPSLSLPMVTNITDTTATAGVTTDSSSGTLYIAVTTSATAPTASAIKAGTGFTFAANQSITTTGAKTFSVTGLTASTTYYHYYVHNNVVGDSAVLSGASFNTISLAPPVLSSATTTSVTTTTATAGVTTDSSSGTLYIAVTTSATAPTASAIKAGTGFTFAANQSITTTGAKTFSVTGLTASTTYYHHTIHNNTNGDSNILTSSSFTTSAGASYILDTLAVAPTNVYSMRKLLSAYSGNAIRVRRSSDNTEQDIGFSSNILDTTTLLSFVGAGTGYVVTWYDQSGNNRDLTQTTQSQQAIIVSSGILVVNNGVPYMTYPSGGIMFTSTNFSWGGTVCMSAVAWTSASSYRRLVNVGTDNLCFFGSVSGNAAVFVGTGTGWNDVNANVTSVAVTSPSVMSFVNNGATLRPFTNGTTHTTKNGATITVGSQVLGLGTFSTQDWSGRVAELIAWQGLSTTDRRTLEVDQGTYYGVTV